VEPAPIVLRLVPGSEPRGFQQRLADTWLWSDRPIGSDGRPARLPQPARDLSPGGWRLVYDGPGLVDGRIERIVSRIAPGGERRVEFADGECYVIAADGSRLLRVRGGPGPDARPARALGAPLALSLALRGIYLLHASAVRSGACALACVAPSGGGKSTLARHAAMHGLPRLADDILPVRLDWQAEALPRFPQLKLAPEELYPQEAPDVLPLGGLVEIAHSPSAAAISIERLAPAAAAFALVRATVAARLFDEELLTRHFAACTRAAARLPVFRSVYPSGLERLGEVAAALRSLPLDLS